MDRFHIAGWTRFSIGPGGLHCFCCAPPPKERKYRMTKLARRELKENLLNELDEYYAELAEMD